MYEDLIVGIITVYGCTLLQARKKAMYDEKHAMLAKMAKVSSARMKTRIKQPLALAACRQCLVTGSISHGLLQGRHNTGKEVG